VLENVCGWSRDIDWGNAPAWAAVVVATVVGTFTIGNVIIARRAYVDSAWDRKVRVSRLVWATKGPAVGYSAGDSFRPNQSLFPSRLPDYGSASTFFENVQDPDSGEMRYLVSHPFTLMKVNVTNNSDEPIGSVRIALLYRGEPLNYAPVAFRVIPPRTTRSVKVFADIKYERRQAKAIRVRVRFTDSAGHRWQRVGTSPPTEVPHPKPPRFPQVQSWKNRRIAQL
jgi:hypothetical protein